MRKILECQFGVEPQSKIGHLPTRARIFVRRMLEQPVTITKHGVQKKNRKNMNARKREGTRTHTANLGCKRWEDRPLYPRGRKTEKRKYDNRFSKTICPGHTKRL